MANAAAVAPYNMMPSKARTMGGHASEAEEGVTPGFDVGTEVGGAVFD